jgi:hypothetical protein
MVFKEHRTMKRFPMRKFVDSFIHTQGVHCESTAIRDVLNYYGLRISEDMVFGLDCTFGFAYCKEKFPYSPFYISGKICTFPNTLPELLGVNVEKNHGIILAIT